VRSSNAFGKSKMVVQSLAMMLFLVSGILDLKTWVTVSLYMLWVALALAVLSGGTQIYDMFWRRPPRT
jgi:phosphatidylglycerophosphate synthase